MRFHFALASFALVSPHHGDLVGSELVSSLARPMTAFSVLLKLFHVL